MPFGEPRSMPPPLRPLPVRAEFSHADGQTGAIQPVQHVGHAARRIAPGVGDLLDRGVYHGTVQADLVAHKVWPTTAMFAKASRLVSLVRCPMLPGRPGGRNAQSLTRVAAVR